MYSSFIPFFHFVNPEEKLKPAWCWDAVTYCWYSCNNRNLLAGKNVEEIEEYASGDFSMEPYKRMYKSYAKKANKDIANNNNNIDRFDTRVVNPNDIGYSPLPLIPMKLDSAVSTVQKIPIEVKVKAIDPLAAQKKNEDLTFLKNKGALQAQLQELADKMQVGKVDLGTTRHSATPFSDSPYGLDLQEPDELQVFIDLLYNLGVEAAFETSLEAFQEIKNGMQLKLLGIRDQFKLGVSVESVFESTITGLPDINYVFPGCMETPFSNLPDYGDNSHRFKLERMTVMEMFNAFGDEICDANTLYNIINQPEVGYCACNGRKDTILQKDFNTYKVDMVYCEIKSVDSVSFSPLNKKSNFSYVVIDPEESKECTNKVWGQNTYCFYWLRFTKYFFKIHRLSYANRAIGREAYQTFSTNIYKSKQKSAVELSIGENKKAQIADIKMQHAIIKSLPAGKYLNLKYLRGALTGLITDGEQKYTIDDLINLAMEQNWFIGDTEGFDGKNDGQLKPFEDIPGGIKSELIGYMTVINDAAQKISQFTGINDQLTGQSANPEGLIGLQKLLINSSINALSYVNEAIANQEKKKFTIWATIIQSAIKKGGKTKQAIIDIIGAKKVSLIEFLDDSPLHTIGVGVEVKQREEERQEFRVELNRLKIQGVINTIDEYMLSGVTNPSDRMALLAVKYKQWQKRQERQRQEDFANQQAIAQQQGQNMVAAQREKGAQETQHIYSQGEVEAHLLQLGNDLGVRADQLNFLGKRALQQDRSASQLDKSVKTLETKQTLKNQEAFQS